MKCCRVSKKQVELREAGIGSERFLRQLTCRACGGLALVREIVTVPHQLHCGAWLLACTRSPRCMLPCSQGARTHTRRVLARGVVVELPEAMFRLDTCGRMPVFVWLHFTQYVSVSKIHFETTTVTNVQTAANNIRKIVDKKQVRAPFGWDLC